MNKNEFRRYIFNQEKLVPCFDREGMPNDSISCFMCSLVTLGACMKRKVMKQIAENPYQETEAKIC